MSSCVISTEMGCQVPKALRTWEARIGAVLDLVEEAWRVEGRREKWICVCSP